jgi:hypothetical protein
MSSIEENAAAKDTSRRTIFVVLGIVTGLLLGGIIYMAKRPDTGATNQQPRLEGALRAGSPDFEKYRDLIKLEKPDADEGTRAIGDIVMTLRTTVRNFTGRTISGLEMRASVVDLSNKPVKERTAIVVPNSGRGITELDNNKTMPVGIIVEGMSKADVRANIHMEVTAIRFK